MFQENCPPWTGEHLFLLFPVECSTLIKHEELPTEKHFQHIFGFDQSCQNLLALGNNNNNDNDDDDNNNNYYYYYIVTCQPFVGLRNRVSRHRPVNKVLPRRGDVTQQRWNTSPARGAMTSQGNVTCVYVVARRRAAILSDCKGSGKHDVTVVLNNAMTIARRPLTQLGYISEAVCRFSSVPGATVKKSVFRKQLYERVLRSSPMSQLLSSRLKKVS
jgi:hypothetical protein